MVVDIKQHKSQFKNSNFIIDVDTTEKLVTIVLVVINSMPKSICNGFTLDWPSGKIATFTGYRCLMTSCTGFLKPRRSRLGPLKFTFNAENFLCSLSLSIFSDFGAIRS